MMHIKTGNYNLLATHIKSKVRYFKDKFTALLELQLASGFGWDAARGCIVADAEIFHGWVLGHPKAKGLNNKPLPYLDDFYVIFGEDHALDHDAVMEDIINQGIDLDATGLKEVETEITSKQVQRKGKEVATSVKRQHLYAELAKFTRLSVSERTRAMRHLNRDDGDAATFFQFPTEEEKLEFVWTILE
ncbi:hypothetical protein LINGRAHAP2_LOCUS28835 [Linum grandiflorum]